MKNLKINNITIVNIDLYYLHGLKIQIYIDTPRIKKFIMGLPKSLDEKVVLSYNNKSYHLPLKGYGRQGETKYGKNFRMKKWLVCYTLDIDISYDCAKEIFNELVKYEPTVIDDNTIRLF